MIRSSTTAGRARNGLIALLGALLTLAAAASEAGAATETFTNPYAKESSGSMGAGSAEAHRDAATHGYNLRLDVEARSADDYAEDLTNVWYPSGSASVGTSLARVGRSAPRITATVRVLSLIDTTRSPGVFLSLNTETRRDGFEGCTGVQANGAGTYTLECTADVTGSSLSAWVGMADTIHDGLYTGPAGRSSATAIVESVTVTT